MLPLKICGALDVTSSFGDHNIFSPRWPGRFVYLYLKISRNPHIVLDFHHVPGIPFFLFHQHRHSFSLYFWHQRTRLELDFATTTHQTSLLLIVVLLRASTFSSHAGDIVLSIPYRIVHPALPPARPFMIVVVHHVQTLMTPPQRSQFCPSRL